LTDELDNPFWSALATRHRALALHAGTVARYPAGYAPFVAVAAADAAADADLEGLLEPGENVYFLGVLPHLPPRWSVHAYRPLAQMVCDRPLEVPDGPPWQPLGEAQRADVLALTALVYPHYFRPRTMELGRYFGIYEDGRLAAMIGERLATPTQQEVSAVCTHPDFNGRGYARRLLALLSNDLLERGMRPFLHVSHENTRAESLYERMGYRVRRDIGFWSVRRAGSQRTA
jgi:ribosomal protein S18 acetylase RimI-like enzyme